MNLLRATITTCVEGLFKLAQLSARAGETISGAELLQQYGFTSRPKSGAEAVLVVKGNMAFVLATDDRRYRLVVEEGEVALYSDEGDKIHFKRGRNVDLVAGTKLSILSPATELSGDLIVKGKVSAVGNVESAANVRDSVGTVASVRTTYDTHTHTDSMSGTTTPPLQQM